ncbi:MAG: YggT family protein [Cyanobacteria bacterium P01_H01_bin.121]
MTESLAIVLRVLQQTVAIYSVLLIIRIILTWFPTIDWYSQPFAFLSQMTDPYLNIFRSIIPPLGGLDFSPMLAIILLQVVSSILSEVAVQAVLASSMVF